MKKFAVAAVLVLAGAAVHADPIEGVWQTQPDDGAFAHVQIAPCGAAFCGSIVRAFSAADNSEIQTPNVGKQIVIDMAPQGGGAYTGKVLRPADNKIYNGKANVDGDRMSLAGCVAGGLICKSQSWVRAQ